MISNRVAEDVVWFEQTTNEAGEAGNGFPRAQRTRTGSRIAASNIDVDSPLPSRDPEIAPARTHMWGVTLFTVRRCVERLFGVGEDPPVRRDPAGSPATDSLRRGAGWKTVAR